MKEEDKTEVKDKILGVARKLFITNGYKGTSIRDIATESDTNIAMINYYFGSKYNLFEIVFQEGLNVLWNRVFNAIDSSKDFYTLIEEWICAYYDVLTEYPQLPIFILNEINVNPQRLTNRLKALKPHDLYIKVSRRIAEEEKKGNIRPTPPLDFMLNVLSMSIFPFIFRNLAQPVAGVSNQTYEEMILEHKDYVIRFTLNALRPLEDEDMGNTEQNRYKT